MGHQSQRPGRQGGAAAKGSAPTGVKHPSPQCSDPCPAALRLWMTATWGSVPGDLSLGHSARCLPGWLREAGCLWGGGRDGALLTETLGPHASDHSFHGAWAWDRM